VVADFFLLRFLSVRLLPRRVLGHLMLQGRVRQVSRLVLRRAYVAYVYRTAILLV
jgi:hypothetical protein